MILAIMMCVLSRGGVHSRVSFTRWTTGNVFMYCKTKSLQSLILESVKFWGFYLLLGALRKLFLSPQQRDARWTQLGSSGGSSVWWGLVCLTKESKIKTTFFFFMDLRFYKLHPRKLTKLFASQNSYNPQMHSTATDLICHQHTTSQQTISFFTMASVGFNLHSHDKHNKFYM